ncbi:putative pyruvate, phosphate dikinase regulatory protein [Clostridium pasteurianum DSM 525 = ATCC 6013]|uniref:Putative pyruvate, phosphate dikinase regulatory protein n=1 Tax=Clostridium pasteurianum DSM 525 = ATCC 6013 TaxID=1262449 RepID=A0A0H3JAZ3_CLOPA|nr:pyruvate, water dikinase regulatory protein [Clostridium pasteurianum]AJA50008.1 putative pyruvate, phosphate dikinase regulatory protein [Clostridium pasteurianum DSM 525 = ATCC 6013]AJA53996.1 putative pyruvate, phosphate dikinase regulatory protein [Clostridium pasteurianum DSM 525 = ATCC 6013]AOZ77139.1 phosphotransferase [Clostridium pasteurianum DSM 525 = ATCC 6013]AOZ80936.1 phosphotransferase [Clostridium pasteurianum]ELP59282.1 PEP synthetase regulatory protein [Clostridium pasteur
MLTIYAVSDSIGETAEQVAKAVSSQFNEPIEIKRITYINRIQDVDDFVNGIEDVKNSIVISTIILVEIREFLIERCMKLGIPINNVLAPSISIISRMLKKVPEYKPGAVWDMNSRYYKRIQAIEFAIQCDDSKDNNGIKKADVILIGLSRTSKTALCMYLANKGIKALNIPLMPEVDVPKELYEISRKKIIGLTIEATQLIDIRRHRLNKFGVINKNIQYANAERVLQELEFADNIMRKLNCRVIDVTKRAIEDTALIIMESIKNIL